MGWAEAFVVIPTLAYLAASVAYFVQGQVGFALAYLAYAVANCGLLLAAMDGRA